MSEQDADESTLRLFGIMNSSRETVSIYGLTVPASFILIIGHSDKRYSLNIRVDVDPEHGPLPRAVSVNANPGTPYTYKDALDLLKGRSMDDVLHDAVLKAARGRGWDDQLLAEGKLSEDGRFIGPPLTADEQARLGANLSGLDEQIEKVPPPVRRRSVTRKLLEEVTGVYRTAMEVGHPPTKAVADHFGTTHASAARWVREARKAGLMGPAVGPTGGELPAVD